jgi:hypothetical protein
MQQMRRRDRKAPQPNRGSIRHIEFIMRAKQLFTFATLALAASAVFADEAPGAPLTRAEVARSVLAARAAGALAPAGSAYDGPPARTAPSTSSLTRSDMKADVLQARAGGTLRHAGDVGPEEVTPVRQALSVASTVTRAEVKAEVLQARASGELTPAGEAEVPMAQVSHTMRTAAARSHPLVGSGAN